MPRKPCCQFGCDDGFDQQMKRATSPRKPGRPPRTDNPQQLACWISAEAMQRLRDWAEAHGRPLWQAVEDGAKALKMPRRTAGKDVDVDAMLASGAGSVCSCCNGSGFEGKDNYYEDGTRVVCQACGGATKRPAKTTRARMPKALKMPKAKAKAKE